VEAWILRRHWKNPQLSSIRDVIVTCIVVARCRESGSSPTSHDMGDLARQARKARILTRRNLFNQRAGRVVWPSLAGHRVKRLARQFEDLRIWLRGCFTVDRMQEELDLSDTRSATAIGRINAGSPDSSIRVLLPQEEVSGSSFATCRHMILEVLDFLFHGKCQQASQPNPSARCSWPASGDNRSEAAATFSIHSAP